MPRSADNIATFVEVVRRQSLSGAARSAGLPKSTISRRLKRLEQDLHSQLLQRDARKITLTAAGRRFYESVVGAVDALDAAVAELEQSRTEPRGTIRLTAPPDLGRMIIAPMLVAFVERYPEIGIDLSLTNRFVDLVQEGADLAVRAGRLAGSDLIARKVCDSELQLGASPKTAASLGDDLHSLQQRPFVLYRSHGGEQTIKLERTGAKKPASVELKVSGNIQVDDYAAMAELVAAGNAIGLMPRIHLLDAAQSGRLTRVFGEWASRSAPIHLVYPTRLQPERTRLLSSFLIEAFSRVGSV